MQAGFFIYIDEKIMKKHVHILGICGTFMGGIAVLAKQCGYHVTGCDLNVYPPMSTQLAALGIELIQGFDADQLKTIKPDVFIVGNVMKRGQPIIEAILNQNLPYISGPQWLYEHILKDKWVLAVAGTHGKTTTSALLSWILEDANLQPGFLIGGIPQNFGTSARLTESPFFVIEADEYDTAFFDKRAKFVHYHPRTLILNNLEFDHADIYPNLEAIETQFHHLVRMIPSQGLIIHPQSSPALTRVLHKGCWSEQQIFDGPPAPELALQFAKNFALTGQHNAFNAQAALLAAQHVGVPLAIGYEALTRFLGVKRRLEQRGRVHEITVYDDFAHHPTAIETTLLGLRDRLTQQSTTPFRILAVLEPRSNTMKMGVLQAQLPASLASADHVFCYTPPEMSWDVPAALAPLGSTATHCDTIETLIKAIIAEAKPQDHIVIMSNGGFGGIHEKLLKQLACQSAVF